MITTINQLRRSFAMRGALGTLQMCAVYVMARLRPEARCVENLRQESDAAFDREWNVNTSGIFRPAADEVLGGNWRYGISYQGVNPNDLVNVLSALDIYYPDFTFVDFGSGKGRAVLIASTFPFKRIVGVEFCSDLNRIARQNLVRHPVSERRCNEIDLVNADAAEFSIPAGPLVLFLFNPFARPVMQRVVNHVRDSFRVNPRRIIVIYFTPYEADLWQATGLFKRIEDTPAIFDTGNV